MKYIQVVSNIIVAWGEVFTPVETWPEELIHVPDTINLSTLHEYVYVSDVLIHVGTKPSQFHKLDAPTASWVPDIPFGVIEKQKEVEIERTRRNLLPLTLNSINLDADLKSQRNLSDKLQEVRERIRLTLPMPQQLLIWKDADNNIQAFSDLQSYHDWLSTYAIALAERGTLLYAAAWQHKSNLEALTSIDEILNYDITQGWV